MANNETLGSIMMVVVVVAVADGAAVAAAKATTTTAARTLTNSKFAQNSPNEHTTVCAVRAAWRADGGRAGRLWCRCFGLSWV